MELTDATTDVVNFDFNDTLPVGYKVVFYWYNWEDGIDVDLKDGATVHQTVSSDAIPVNATLAVTPGGVAEDRTLTIDLLDDTDSVIVRDGGFGKWNYLFEIRVLDLDGNEVPFTCS